MYGLCWLLPRALAGPGLGWLASHTSTWMRAVPGVERQIWSCLVINVLPFHAMQKSQNIKTRAEREAESQLDGWRWQLLGTWSTLEGWASRNCLMTLQLGSGS